MTQAAKTGRLVAGKRSDVDMTQGGIVGHLIRFAYPLLLGNLFQQLYNMVDTWVVGNYVSNEAFSAVGSVGPIINMLIGLFLGFSSGAGVVISQYYGVKQYDNVQKTVHTALVVTIGLGVVFSGVGIAIAPAMLRMMKTPAEVLPESKAYLTIYFAGILGLMVYNICSGILRAVGDSKHPFYFLVVSAVTNIVLDLVFVLLFKMGVEGVAYATILSQALSAVLVVITLVRSDSCVKLKFSALRVDWRILKKIMRIGVPSAFQMAITSFSNVFVQSYINHFGADCMSGWTAYGKIDQLILLPMQSIALATTTFVGQNLGAGLETRARKGATKALVISVCTTAVAMIPVLIFAPQFTAFFNAKAEVIEYGTLFLRWITPFYLVTCVNQIYSGVLRGAGNSRLPMIAMLCSFVVFRQIYLFIVANFISNTIIPIAMGYPAGWVVCSALTLWYYKTTKLTVTTVVDQKD